jgi:putative transposase
MHFIPDQVYHIYNRGNNKQRTFLYEKNYYFFLTKIEKQISPVCNILAWCLMPNHFHLLIYATEESCIERASFGGKPMQELSYQIGILLSSYSQAINKQNKTTGSLFQQKTKAKCITTLDIDCDPGNVNNSYLITCMHYIHQNPWKAGLANGMENWKFSSFHNYIGGNIVLKCDHDLLLALTAYSMTTFYEDSYSVIDDENIRMLFE